ncbi:MAG: hypothetical protein ACI95T_001144 [Flavobacteriales bacterium]
MKVDKSNIKLINKSLGELAKRYELIGEYFDEKPSDYEVKIGDTEIHIPFPRDAESIHKIEEFYRLIDEFDSIEIKDRNKTVTKRFTQRVIASDLGIIEHLLSESNFEITTSEGIKIRLVSSPILIGIAAMELREYDKFAPPCSLYTAVEVEYIREDKRLNEEKENKLLQSYFFELANKLHTSIHFTQVSESGFYGTEDDEESKLEIPKLKEVEEFNVGMEMYLKAIQPLDEDIRLLYFYKILEYFAPVVVKIKANEKLRNKLDSPKAINPDADFLQSIYKLTRKFDEDLKDKDLVKAVFRECFDIIDLFEYLPESLKKRVRGQLREKDVSYELSEEKMAIAANMLGGIIYSTRNSIVHAKSNYETDNNECAIEDLSELNNFLKHACYSTIKWYNRLPNHLKIENES